MPKYMIEARYNSAAVKGVLKEGGTSRRDAAMKAAASVGGKTEAFYYAFGETDLYMIVDFPDEASAVAVSMVVNATGTTGVRLVPLIAPETLDEAVKKAVVFRPPGG